MNLATDLLAQLNEPNLDHRARVTIICRLVKALEESGDLLDSGRLREAHEHLNRAHRLLGSLKDKGAVAQVDATRARLLLAEKRVVEAERTVRGAVRALEEGGEQSLLAGALTTHGTALARLSEYEEARSTFEKACEVAYQAGDSEGAGLAALSMLEELCEQFTREERLEAYERADHLLSQTQHPGILARLRACARQVLALPPARLKADASAWPNLIYASDKMAEVLKRAHRIATTSHPLLITGETGTGKELLAQLVHEWSGRAGELVVVNCSALAGGPAESELFGHRQGSFEDAFVDCPGVVRLAEGGTLLLDEIAELSLGAQAKLLRVIEHSEIQTVGQPLPQRVDVRIVVSTNQDIKQKVTSGGFREDLFYRLQPFRVDIPPLRERPEDIEALAKHFINEALEDVSRRVVFTPEAMSTLRLLPMEGNVRQLRNLIERLLLAAEDGPIISAEMVEAADLRSTEHASPANPWEGFSLKDEVRRFEAGFIELALKEAEGKVSLAARLLGFKHHESLTSLLENKHRDLLEARLPATPRRRSIMRYNKTV